MSVNTPKYFLHTDNVRAPWHCSSPPIWEGVFLAVPTALAFSLLSSPKCFVPLPECFLTCLSTKTPRLSSVTFRLTLNCVRPPWLQVRQGVVSVVAVRKVVDVELPVPAEPKQVPRTSKRPAEQTVNCEPLFVCVGHGIRSQTQTPHCVGSLVKPRATKPLCVREPEKPCRSIRLPQPKAS